MDIKTDNKRIYEQIYAHKFDNWDNMNYFLEKCKLPKFTQEKQIIWIELCLLNKLNQ